MFSDLSIEKRKKKHTISVLQHFELFKKLRGKFNLNQLKRKTLMSLYAPFAKPTILRFNYGAQLDRYNTIANYKP